MPRVRVGSGFELFYREDGAGDPILWIMGLGGDHRGWAGQVPAFRDRFRCITYDNRDAGRSQRATEAYTVAHMAGDAVGLLDALEVKSAHVVGFSMGGAQAQELAIRHPERVARLVLCCTYTAGDPRGTAIFDGHLLLRERLSREEFQRVTMPWVYTHSDYRRAGFIEQTLEAIVGDPNPQPLDAYRRQVEGTTTFYSEDRLGEIGSPTLLLFGGDDILAPARFLRTLQRGIPHAETHVVKEAGHGLPWSHLDEFNRVVRAFLDG